MHPSYCNTNVAVMKLHRLWYSPKKEVPKDMLLISPKRISKVLTAI